MTITAGELAKRLAGVPDNAKLFMYSLSGDLRLQAEWVDREDPVEAPIGGKPHFKQLFNTRMQVQVEEIR